MPESKIPTEIISHANDFYSWFTKYKNYSKTYELDHSWISLSIIDTLLKRFRSFGLRTNIESEFFKKSISHLSISFSNILEELGFVVEVFQTEDLDICLLLKYEGEHVINIERDILHLLITTPINIRVENENFIPLSRHSNYIVPYFFSILGFSTDLFPRELLELKLRSVPSYFEDINKVISKQVASWHEKVWPNCHLSHVPEIYLNKVVNPHFLLSENPPFEDASNGVLTYFNNLGLKIGIVEGQDKPRVPRQLSSLLQAWASCPDEQISLLAVSLSSIYPSWEEVPAQIICSAISRNYSTPLVRQAFYKNALVTRNASDWTDIGVTNLTENELIQEKIMDIIPWISLSSTYLKKNYLAKDLLKDFISNIKVSSMLGAEAVISKMLEDTPGDVELRTQAIKFLYLRGEYEKAHLACKMLLSEPNADSSPYFLNLWGMILSNMGKVEVASRYFKKALSLPNCIGLYRADVLTLFSQALIAESRFEEAKEALRESLEICPDRVSTIMNLAYVLGAENSKNTNDYKDLLLKAANLSPFDLRVVAGIFYS